MWRKCQISAFFMLLVGCRQDMHDQPKAEPLEESKLFLDGRSARDPVEGTIARGQLQNDRHLHFGREELAEPLEQPDDGTLGELVDTFPFEVTPEVMQRGRERYDIYCSPCHARTGNGDGMIVRRGYQKPPSLHDPRLQDPAAPQGRVGHLYDVIRRGIGAMPAYAAQLNVNDRWAVVAYVRALQLHKNARIEDVPAEARSTLGGGP